MADAFSVLMRRLRAATDAEGDPVDRLRAGCAAYVAFAAEQPQRYRVLFQLRAGPGEDALLPAASVDEMVGADAFGLLVESIRACVEAGRSASPSPEDSALQLWIAMHGYATLRVGTPGFPWPDSDAPLDALIDRLAYLA
jgi:AcrR family transcriptional regulator